MHKNLWFARIYMLWDVLGGVDTETAYMKDRQPSTGTPLGIP